MEREDAYFVTFADSKYSESLKRISKEAKALRYFNKIFSFDEKDRIAFRLAPERIEMAKYKASVLNKSVEDIMEIRYSWWESGYYMAIEEWIQNNPDLYTSTVIESPYPNSEHTLYDIKGVKMLHITSAESDSTYTI